MRFKADVPLMKTFAFTECAFGRDRLKFTQLKVRSKGCRGELS